MENVDLIGELGGLDGGVESESSEESLCVGVLGVGILGVVVVGVLVLYETCGEETVVMVVDLVGVVVAEVLLSCGVS